MAASLYLAPSVGQGFIVEMFFSAIFFVAIMDLIVEVFSKYVVYFFVPNTIHNLVLETREVLLQHGKAMSKEEIIGNKDIFCAQKYLFPSRSVAINQQSSSVEKAFILLYSQVLPGRAGIWLLDSKDNFILKFIKFFGCFPVMLQNIIMSILLEMILAAVLIFSQNVSDMAPWLISSLIFICIIIWILLLFRRQYTSVFVDPPYVLNQDGQNTPAEKPGSADTNISLRSEAIRNHFDVPEVLVTYGGYTFSPRAGAFDCSSCGKSDNPHKKNGKIYCANCLDKTCESCGKSEGNIITTFSRDGQSLCIGCVDDVCRKCRSKTDIRLKFSTDGETLCQKCKTTRELLFTSAHRYY